MFEQAALDTEKGEEQLEDFVKVRLDTADKKHGAEYWAFAGRHFNYQAIPLYVVVNADGEITAAEQDISVFGVTTAGGTAQTPVKFQEFLDTAKNKGDVFDYDKGFLPPEELTES